MTSKKSIFLIIFIILLIIGGVFYWQQRDKESITKEILYENIFIPGSDYEIIEMLEEKIIENRNEGLTIRVPQNWIIKKYDESIGLFSPEIEFDEHGGFLASIREKGACGMGIEIYKSQKINPELPTFAEILTEEIIYLENNVKEQKNGNYINEVIIVSSNKGIKRIYTEDEEIRLIEVEIPVGQTVYSFSSLLIIEQKCIDEFSQILESIEIEK